MITEKARNSRLFCLASQVKLVRGVLSTNYESPTRKISMKNNLQLIALLSLALSMFAIALYFFRPIGQNSLTRATVSGEAETEIAPDTALITFAVVTQNAQAVAAQQENARKSEAVQQAVEAVVVAANARHEVKTSDYSLQPEQDYGGKMPKIVGYTARNAVTISIGDLEAVGAVIDAATKAGANSVEGVSFVVREDSPARGASLAVASRQAMAKAETLAKSLNGQIVRVVESREGGIDPRPSTNEYNYNMSNASMTANRSYTTPVQAGKLNMRSQVVLIVEIEVKKHL
jgi:uncharacterized protein